MAKLREEYGANAWYLKNYEIQTAVKRTDKYLQEITPDPAGN